MKLFDCASVGFLLVLSVNMVIILFRAFFNNYECMVTVNNYGEAVFEIVIFPVWLIMGSITLVRMAKRYWQA